MKFRKAPALTVVLLVVFSFTVYGQRGDLRYTSYYYDYKLLNPAIAGIKDKHIITAVYSGFHGGTQSTFGDAKNFMFYGSYETSIPSIKSGIGALIGYEEMAAISTFQSSIFFNRKFAFNDRSGLRVGTRLSYLLTEIDYSVFQYLYKDDPLMAGKEGREGENRFNFDLGVLYYSRIAEIGFSVKDILKEEINLVNREVLSRTSFNATVTREFKIRDNLKVRPSVVYQYHTDYDWELVDINSIFEIRQWLLLGGGYSIGERKNHVSFSAGVNIKEWVQVIAHVYSSEVDEYRDRTGSQVEAMVRVNIPHPKAKE